MLAVVCWPYHRVTLDRDTACLLRNNRTRTVPALGGFTGAGWIQGGSKTQIKTNNFFLKNRCFEAAGVDADFRQVEQSQVYLLSSSTPVFEHVSRGETHVPVWKWNKYIGLVFGMQISRLLSQSLREQTLPSSPAHVLQPLKSNGQYEGRLSRGSGDRAFSGKA